MSFVVTMSILGSAVVECVPLDQGVADSSLAGVTVLCPLGRNINPCLVLVLIQDLKNVDWDIKYHLSIGTVPFA